MMSFTWASSDCARDMSSVGGDVLYVYTSCDMTGPRVDCRAWGGKVAEEDEEAEGLDRNYATVSALRTQ